MLTLLSEIHFWSSQDDIIIKNIDYGAFKYNTKRDSSDSIRQSSKKSYCEKRGLTWAPANKRPHKLKEKLKELEDQLAQNRIVCISWEESNVLLLLSKGIFINITYNVKNCDIVSITTDKYLVSKIQNELICDGAIKGQHVVCICTDGRVFGYGGTWRDGWSIEGGPRRHVYLQGECLAVWGRSGSEHPQPWSPLTKDHQRANLHLYWIATRGPDLLGYKKTSAEPISVVISRLYPKSLIIVEQKVSQRGAVSVEVSVLELINSTLKRASVTAVPLQTQVSCSTLSRNENFLLLGCIDGSVALLDRNRGSTKIVKTSFIPTLAMWHESNCMAVVANERGQIQYIDAALNFLKCQIVCEDCTPNSIVDMSSYFNTQPTVVSINWGPKDLVVALEHGPVTLLTHMQRSLGFLPLVQKYLDDGKVDKAIGLLLCWDFNEDCFSALQKIVAHLMRLPLTEENARLLQNALGCYYSPPVPLNPEISHHYGFQVKALTRRFFHQLMRTSMFETAFLLAVDIGHHDLFMDLHYIAVKIGETEMAAAARAQASTLLSRCSSAASDCSRSSCSQCSETSSSSEDISSLEHQHQKPYQQQIFSDNYLTTNFNNTNPKTYSTSTSFSTYIPPIPNIDLPKINFNKYNKPQLPYSRGVTSTVNAPPLPIAPPLPVAPILTNSNQFTQFTSASNYQSPNYAPPPLSYASLQRSFVPFNNNPRNATSSRTFNCNNFAATSVHSPELKQKVIVPPPLPIQPPPLPTTTLNSQIVTHPSNSLNNPIYSTTNQSSTNLTVTTLPITNSFASVSSTSTLSVPPQGATKKAQAKVKFSDTVTAFIVPEIKRPVRPPLPAHVMDPQKELADSLPLCHPNEDYLKDFAPVKRNENGETPTPKIKVVHFGVV